jgi:hypothetical protein
LAQPPRTKRRVMLDLAMNLHGARKMSYRPAMLTQAMRR